MNIGKARDPRVAMILQPKNLVIADGLDDSASRCMAVRNSVKRGTKSTPRMIASLKSNFVSRRPSEEYAAKNSHMGFTGFFFFYLAICLIISHFTNEYFVKNKKVGQISGKIAQFLANWTEGMLRDR
mmetsp:Transcript_18677/g.21726  ORF Transcript_18677/g.21726 Transcript_18677/m.21726 type:complete len:127 (+) Transcript_18677:27-407(+)